jgi:hypothetical protein
MITSGVSERQAKILYLAVVYGGPQWDLQTVSNNVLSSKSAIDGAARMLGVSAARGPGDVPSDTAIVSDRQTPKLRPGMTPAEAQKYADMISNNNPSIDDIDRGQLGKR